MLSFKERGEAVRAAQAAHQPKHIVERPAARGEWVTSVKYQAVAASGHVIDEADDLGAINQRVAMLAKNPSLGITPITVDKVTTSVLIEDANQDGPRRA